MFFFPHTFDREQVLVRLQQVPVMQGLREIDPGLVGDIAAGDEPGPTDTVVIQYMDIGAIKQAAELKQRTGCKVVCFGSDVMDDRLYVALDPLIDHFLMPTPLHRDLVGASVWKPCSVLPEGIDPIALPGDGMAIEPVTRDTSLGWFGYARNFGATLGSIFQRALQATPMRNEQLTVISSEGQEILAGAAHVPFSSETFYRESARISHVVLSHFPYDSLINTYIKSPNKLITSLVRGMTPIVSATPSYQVLMRQYELQHLMFRNGPELTLALRRLPELRLDDGKLAAIRADLESRLNPVRIARRFLELVG